MHRIIPYLKFLWSSTNQHGVHSPFVYGYVTKCLYAKQLSKDSTVKDVLFKSIGFFGYKNVCFVGMGSEFQNAVLKMYPSIRLDTPPYDLIYIDKLNAGNISTYIEGNKEIHNDTAVLINGIHENKEVETLWEVLMHSGEIRVTIDLFCCGVLFFRAEQAKEHFKIRI